MYERGNAPMCTVMLSGGLMWMYQHLYCCISFACAVLATGREKEDWNSTEKEGSGL